MASAAAASSIPSTDARAGSAARGVFCLWCFSWPSGGGGGGGGDGDCGDEGGGDGGGGGGRGGRALRLDAAPPVERVERRVAAGGGDAKRWTFGDEKARLELALPWPTEPLRGGFARVEFGEGAAEVRPAPARKRRRAT